MRYARILLIGNLILLWFKRREMRIILMVETTHLPYELAQVL